MITGRDRGQIIFIDPETVAAVVTDAVSTYTPTTYTVYLKNGVVFNVELGENDLLGRLERFLTH